MKKTVVICGANVIGAAAAQALAEAGWNAALLDADLTKAQDAVKDLPGALPLCCDPLSERSVKDAVTEAAEHFGGTERPGVGRPFPCGARRFLKWTAMCLRPL